MATSKRQLLERQYNIVGRLKALTWLLLATGVPYSKETADKFRKEKAKLIKVTDQLNETIKAQNQKRKATSRAGTSGGGAH